MYCVLKFCYTLFCGPFHKWCWHGNHLATIFGYKRAHEYSQDIISRCQRKSTHQNIVNIATCFAADEDNRNEMGTVDRYRSTS